MGAYTLLQDLTVSSNSTSVVLNNFGTITKDDFVKIVTTFIDPNGSNKNIEIVANSSVSSNYHRQQLNADGNVANAGRGNNSRYTFVASNTSGTSGSTFSYLKLSENNRLNIFVNETRANTSAIKNTFNYITSSGATFTSGITSLTFTGDQTNGIGTGSRIQIYKLDAEKVADITVTSNTTQVDISNLSIDKDSEYLLVSDGTNGTTSNINVSLTPNDLTTLTGYHRQRIFGAGSTAGASRVNDASFLRFKSSTKTMSYTHIKLSNIGAYTHQSYNIANYGTSNIEIDGNDFVSSTAENITSITKLNIVSPTTNAIAAGSRFILYKLYE